MLYFDDIRSEEYSPSHSGANTRIDFVLRDEKLIIETKITRENQSTKILGEELVSDIARYSAYPDCNHLVIFIYNKGDHIVNKRGFANDMENLSTEQLKVSVVINPD